MAVENGRDSPRISAVLGGPDDHKIRNHALRELYQWSPRHSTTSVGICDATDALKHADVDTLLGHSVEDFPKASRLTKGETIVADSEETQNRPPRSGRLEKDQADADGSPTLRT